MPTITAPGIGSGLDINGIISKLLDVERRSLLRLDTREASFQTKLSAYGSLKGALSGLQNAVKGLSSADKFLGKTAKVDDESVFTASATTAAANSNYNISITTLAKAHKVASDVSASAGVIGTGSLTFQFGTYDPDANTFTVNSSKPTKTVTISSANQTLSGIRDAVNAANIGVSASIVNDGGGDRLVFSSKETGAANSLKITAADDDGDNTDTSGLSFLAYDPTAAVGSGKNLTETQVAADALFTIDGISITKASNTVTDAIEGVTLNLKKEGASSVLRVAQDKESARKSVEDFVKAYNDAANALKKLTAYNAETKQAGALQGDASTLSIQNRLRNLLNTPLVGSGSKSLSDIGVGFEKDGTLKLNSSKLTTALDSDINAVAKVFASLGVTTDSSIKFKEANSSTKAGVYGINITQYAYGAYAAGVAAPGLTITAGVNDSFALTVNGVTRTITLAAGTYGSNSELAIELNSKVVSAFSGTSAEDSGIVGFSYDDGSGEKLYLSTTKVGSTQTIDVEVNAASNNLFGVGFLTSAGVDVQGTIGGQAATGSGDILIGSGDATGLKIQIPSDFTTGDRGSITYTRGFAVELDKLLGEVSATSGPIDSRTNGLNASIKDIAKQREAAGIRFEATEKRLREQFTRLDKLVASLNSTGNYLQQQLSILQRQTGGSGR